MASPTAVRRALHALLTGFDDLDPEDVRVVPATVEYGAGNDFDHNNYRVWIRAGDSSEKTAERIDQFLDPDGDLSVKRHLESDRSLGGLVSDVRVVKASGYQPVGDDVLGVTFTVEVR